VLRHLEEAGRIRRGYFVGGVGAMQFAQPHALDLLRGARDPAEHAAVAVVAATDPANPYGALLEWPPLSGGEGGEARRPARAVGARVVLVDGAPAVHVARGLKGLLAWLPELEPERARVGKAAARALAELAREAKGRGEGVRIEEVNGAPATRHGLAGFLVAEGFIPSGGGLVMPRRTGAQAPAQAGRPG